MDYERMCNHLKNAWRYEVITRVKVKDKRVKLQGQSAPVLLGWSLTVFRTSHNGNAFENTTGQHRCQELLSSRRNKKTQSIMALAQDVSMRGMDVEECC